MPNLTLQWDPMPATESWREVRLYDGTTLVGMAIPPATSATVTVARGNHTFTARSFDGVQESDPSNAVTIKLPVPPGHLR